MTGYADLVWPALAVLGLVAALALLVRERRAVAAAGRERERFDQSMDATGFCVLVTRLDGTVEYTNDAVTRVLGHVPGALRGRNAHQMVHSAVDREATHSCALDAALRQHRSHFGRDQFVDASGRFVPVSVSCAPILNADARPRAMVLIFRDRSQEEALERQREEVFGLISHELRSPLTSLVGFSRRLRRALETGQLDVGKQHAEEITLLADEAQRMREIVTVLLDMVAMERNVDLSVEPLAPAHLVEEEAEQVRRLYGAASITIDSPEEIVIESDDRYVRRVVYNLLENAAKYSGPSPAITVRVQAADGGCLITVTDRGPGIPLEAQPYIFERFYRDETAAGQRRGLGLGLYLSRRLARRLGGRLTFQSTPGQGSEFMFWLPVECPVVEESSEPAVVMM